MSDVLQKSAENKKPRGHLDPQGFDKHVLFYTYAPPADLAPFLEHFWTLSWDEMDAAYNSDQVMHRPQVDVFISSDWSGIQGTFRGKKTYVAKGKGRIIGMRFLPGAFHAFWNGQMSDLQDSVLDIHQLFPQITQTDIDSILMLEDQEAVAKLIEYLRLQLPQPDTNIQLINQIIAAADTDTTVAVADMAAAYGKSERWLQQLFQTYVGVGLKWLLQRNKLLHAAQRIRDAETPQWTAIAYDAGYSSQQHFITDFKKVTGKTPLQYKKELL
nr:Helix-turn-helix domain protein [uncultured bacterium]AIA14907.1 Helix-turn-helix domain protein [uncultured bacterium]